MEGNFSTQRLESFLEELGIDREDMIDPPEGAKPLCDLSTFERLQCMEGLPRVDLLYVDARSVRTALTIRDNEPKEGSAVGAKGGAHVTFITVSPHG